MKNRKDFFHFNRTEKKRMSKGLEAIETRIRKKIKVIKLKDSEHGDKNRSGKVAV